MPPRPKHAIAAHECRDACQCGLMRLAEEFVAALVPHVTACAAEAGRDVVLKQDVLNGLGRAGMQALQTDAQRAAIFADVYRKLAGS